jgi:hypothetical protein
VIQPSNIPIFDASGRRKVFYQLPYATLRKGRSFVLHGNARRFMTFRGTLSRYARRTGKVFTTSKIRRDMIRVKRWL